MNLGEVGYITIDVENNFDDPKLLRCKYGVFLCDYNVEIQLLMIIYVPNGCIPPP